MTASASSEPKAVRIPLKADRQRGLADGPFGLARYDRLLSLEQSRPGTIHLHEATRPGFR